MMNLYEVVNGAQGETYVRVYVIAASQERALELAREQYRRSNDDPRFYEHLYCTQLCVLDGREVVTKDSDHGWEALDD